MEDRTPDPPFLPDFWQSVRLLLLGVLFIGVIGLGLAILGWLSGSGSRVLGAHADILAQLGVLWVGRRWTARTWADMLPVRPVRLSWVPPMAMALVGLVLTVRPVSIAFASALPAPPDWMIQHFRSAGFLGLVVLAPLVEEALFRGLILGGYRRAYRPAKAALLCGLVFALSHILPWQFPVAFIGGVFFSWLAVETGSLTLPIIGHSFVNAVAWYRLGHPDDGEFLDAQAAFLWIPGVLLLGTGTWLLRRAVRRSGAAPRAEPSQNEISARGVRKPSP